MAKTYAKLLDEQLADMEARDKIKARMLARKADMDALLLADEAERTLAGMTPGQVNAIANAARATAKISAADAASDG